MYLRGRFCYKTLVLLPGEAVPRSSYRTKSIIHFTRVRHLNLLSYSCIQFTRSPTTLLIFIFYCLSFSTWGLQAIRVYSLTVFVLKLSMQFWCISSLVYRWAGILRDVIAVARDIWPEMYIMELVVVQFYAVSCYVLYLRSKHCPQYSVFKNTSVLTILSGRWNQVSHSCKTRGERSS